jgi:hypothetical protein
MRVLSIALYGAFLLCVIGLTANVAEAAGGKISGEVVDANSRQPLPGVSVVVEGPMTARTLTVRNGTFTLRNLIPGSYILITSLDGYETAQSKPIAVVDSMEQAVTLTISRESAAANTVFGPNLTIPAPLFTYTGDLRAFYFGRTNGNTCLTCKTKGSPNATAFNFGGQLHGQVNIPYTPWVLGATYFGDYPFGANWPGPLNNIGYNPLVDNTLPGYSISIFGEAYLQYKTAGMFGESGKEVLSPQLSPWTPNSDSRIEPTAFQGTLLNGNLTPNLNIGGMYMARFKSRVTSAFNANTLLTSCDTAFNTGKGPVQGVPGTFTVPGDPCNKLQKSQGFLQFSAAYKFGGSGLVANAYYYEVYDITSMSWVTAQWNFNKTSKFNPYVAGQFLAENNAGSHLVGTVHDYTYGGQFGATIYRNLNFVVSYNGSPFTTYVVPAKNCKGTVSSPQAASPGVIFGGVADTSVKGLPAGDVQCYGGGVASPYTDNYATDPLYTTQISQGLADVHKPGTGAKAALTWVSDDKRIRLIVSDAWYNYGLPGSSGTTSNGDARSEFNADVTYFFNPVRSGPYKGFSFRQRYADRTQPFSPYDFKYSRTQLEYTF